MEVLASPPTSPREEAPQQPLRRRSTLRKPRTGSDESVDISGQLPDVEWEQLQRAGHLYSARFDHAVTRRKHKIFLFGGNTGAPNAQYLNDLFEYDLSDSRWTCIRPKSTSPSPRAGHSITLHRKRIHVFGGIGSNGKLADLWSYDVESNVWGRRALNGTSLPPARSHHSAVMHDEHLVVYGGCELEGAGTVWRLNMTTKAWELLCTGDGIFSEVNAPLSKSITADQLQTIKNQYGKRSPHLPRPRAKHSAAVSDNKMYIFGGVFLDSSRDVVTNELWCFDLIEKMWANLTSTAEIWPLPRASQAAVMVGRRWIIHGGRTHHAYASRPPKKDDPTTPHSEGLHFEAYGTSSKTFSPTSASSSTSLAIDQQLPLRDVWAFHFSTQQWEHVNKGMGTSESDLLCQAARWGHHITVCPRSGQVDDQGQRALVVTGGATLAPFSLL